MLSDIAHSLDLKLEGFFHDISAMGMFACVRRENSPGEFLLFDFGFSKSTAGLFSFEKNVFKPLYMKVVKVGSVRFDEKLIGMIVEKYSLSDGALIREKIRRGLDKIKTTLNSAEYCSVQLFLTENPLDVTITQEEYRRAVEEELNDLSCFIGDVMKETEFNGVIEVIGGNSSSFLVKELLNGIEYQVTLDISDSSAIGSALGMACNSLKTKYTLHDIVGREISVKIQGEDVKPTVVFKNTELIVGNPKVITYNRKESFTLEIIEDGEVISTLFITKNESDEPEAIHISLSINKLGVVCVSNVECKSGAEYKYLPFGINELDVEEIRSLESRYRDEELGLERIGGMRNELETMAVGLGDVLYGKLSSVVSDEELSHVREIAMDLFDIPASETLEQEEKVRNDILSRLEFISKKLDEYRTSTVSDVERCKEMINEFKKANPKMFTPSFYKLQGILYRIDEYLKGLDLNLFNVGTFDDGFSRGIKEDTKRYLGKAEQEVKVKKEIEEQKKKIEEIGRAHV